jgi:hypothetical protein
MNDNSLAYKDIVRLPNSSNRHFYALLLVAILALATNVFAIELPTLYTVQVPFDPEEKDPRASAYKRGLWEIVVRVTGSELPVETSILEELFPNPARYVLQFRQDSDDETFLITFDGANIENVLRSAGKSVWGIDRPLTLVWLAVETMMPSYEPYFGQRCQPLFKRYWGQDEREITAVDDPQRMDGALRSIDRNRLLCERIQNTASRRGIPITFPLMDTEDLKNVSFTDIWGGFDEQLLQASRRYQVNSILVGRISPGTLKRNRWTYYFDDIQQDWSGEPEDIVNFLADALAAEFSFAGNARLETVTVNIAGIDSVRAYGTVQRFLENLSLIEEFEVHTVKGGKIRYEIRLRGTSIRLARALQSSNILIPIEKFDDPHLLGLPSAMNSLDFMYRAPGRNF